MSNQQFKPPPTQHDIEVQVDGKTHRGQYHLDHNNIVVSFMGGSKVVAQAEDNDALARNILKDIVIAKQQH